MINYHPAGRPIQIAIAFLAGVALLSAPLQAQQPADAEPKPGQPGQPGNMRFPIGSEQGVLAVEWVGGLEARAGQSFEYSLRVTNTSQEPVHNIVVYQTLPQTLRVEQSSPEPIGGTRLGGEQGESKRQENQQQYQRGEQGAEQAAREKAASRQAQQQTSVQQPAPAQEPASTREQPRAQQRQEQPTQPAAESSQPRQGAGKQNQLGDQQTYYWSLGVLKPRETRTIKVTAYAEREGGIQACTWATFQAAYCQDINVVKPDLEIRQIITDVNGRQRSRFYECEQIVARYWITNSGSGATSDANITVDLPQGIATHDGKRQISLPVGKLNPGQTIDRAVQLKPQQTGQFALVASGSTGELRARSGRAEFSVGRPELMLEVEAPDSSYLGRTVTYRISVTNEGDMEAQNTIVRMPAPAGGLRFASSDQRIPRNVDAYNLETVKPGDTRSFSISFDPSEVGDLASTVTASAYCAEEKTQRLQMKIVGVPALHIAAVDRQDPVKTGEITIYEIKVVNEGTAEDLKIQLSGTLPQTVEFVDANGDSEVTGKGQNLQFGAIERLAPGEVASWFVSAKGTKAGRGQLKVEMRSENNRKPVVTSEPTTVF